MQLLNNNPIYRLLIPKPLRTFFWKKFLRSKIINSYKDSSDEEILRLLKKCPVNLDQAFDFTYQEDYRPRLLKSIASYKSFQAEHEASHKFKKL